MNLSNSGVFLLTLQADPTCCVFIIESYTREAAPSGQVEGGEERNRRTLPCGKVLTLHIWPLGTQSGCKSHQTCIGLFYIHVQHLFLPENPEFSSTLLVPLESLGKEKKPNQITACVFKLYFFFPFLLSSVLEIIWFLIKLSNPSSVLFCLGRTKILCSRYLTTHA